MMCKLLVVPLILLITACGGTIPIKYQASSMDINEAKDVLDELTWSQHPKWRPDAFLITEKYIAWDSGVISRSNGFATDIVPGTAIVSSTSIIKNIGDRYYYRSIQKVELSSWKRKFKQWYVVSITDTHDRLKHVLRTRILSDAKMFTDAMTTVVNNYRKSDDLR